MRTQTPGILQRFAGGVTSFFGRKSFDQLLDPRFDEWFGRTGDGPSTKSPAAALKSFKGWTFACVDLISSRVASIDYKLYGRSVRNGKQQLTYVPEHIFYDTIWRAPNPLFTRFEMVYLLSAHLNLAGSAFWYLTLNNFGVPVGAWPLLPHKVEKKLVNGSMTYRYDTGSEKIDLDPELLLEFRRPNPADPHTGWSPLQAVGISYDTAALMDAFQYHTFKSGGFYQYALQTKQVLTSTQIDQIQASWMNKFSTVKSHFQVPVLSGGTTVQQGPSPLDLDLGNLDGMQRDKILGAYRIPKSKLGFSESANKASMFAADVAFNQEVIAPLLTLIDSQFDLRLLPLYGNKRKLTGDFDNPVPTDREAKRADETLYLQQGVMSRNEIRERNDLPPINSPEMNSPMVPMNLFPTGPGPAPVRAAKKLVQIQSGKKGST